MKQLSFSPAWLRVIISPIVSPGHFNFFLICWVKKRFCFKFACGYHLHFLFSEISVPVLCPFLANIFFHCVSFSFVHGLHYKIILINTCSNLFLLYGSCVFWLKEAGLCHAWVNKYYPKFSCNNLTGYFEDGMM